MHTQGPYLAKPALCVPWPNKTLYCFNSIENLIRDNLWSSFSDNLETFGATLKTHHGRSCAAGQMIIFSHPDIKCSIMCTKNGAFYLFNDTLMKEDGHRVEDKRSEIRCAPDKLTDTSYSQHPISLVYQGKCTLADFTRLINVIGFETYFTFHTLFIITQGISMMLITKRFTPKRNNLLSCRSNRSEKQLSGIMRKSASKTNMGLHQTSDILFSCLMCTAHLCGNFVVEHWAPHMLRDRGTYKVACHANTSMCIKWRGLNFSPSAARASSSSCSIMSAISFCRARNRFTPLLRPAAGFWVVAGISDAFIPNSEQTSRTYICHQLTPNYHLTNMIGWFDNAPSIQLLPLLELICTLQPNAWFSLSVRSQVYNSVSPWAVTHLPHSQLVYYTKHTFCSSCSSHCCGVLHLGWQLPTVLVCLAGVVLDCSSKCHRLVHLCSGT